MEQLLANGVSRDGENGLLFEEWCGEHRYLREPPGCEADMARLRAFTADGTRLAPGEAFAALMNVWETAATEHDAFLASQREQIEADLAWLQEQEGPQLEAAPTEN